MCVHDALRTVHKIRGGDCNICQPNPIVNVNASVLKLLSCLISFFMHLSWHSACMYCVVK
jgi:hypothetical protein